MNTLRTVLMVKTASFLSFTRFQGCFQPPFCPLSPKNELKSAKTRFSTVLFIAFATDFMLFWLLTHISASLAIA
jgi:hypothetical protein